MRCGVAVAFPFPEAVENRLKFVTAGDNDTDADSSQFKEQPKIVQIAVEERIFVIPLNFESDLVLEADLGNENIAVKELRVAVGSIVLVAHL